MVLSEGDSHSSMMRHMRPHGKEEGPCCGSGWGRAGWGNALLKSMWKSIIRNHSNRFLKSVKGFFWVFFFFFLKVRNVDQQELGSTFQKEHHAHHWSWRRQWSLLTLLDCFVFQLLIALKLNEDLCARQQSGCRPSPNNHQARENAHISPRLRWHTACLLLRSPSCMTSAHLITNTKEFWLDIYRPTGGVTPHATDSSGYKNRVLEVGKSERNIPMSGSQTWQPRCPDNTSMSALCLATWEPNQGNRKMM